MYLPTTASHASAINLNLKYITHREDGHVGQYKHSVLHVSITNYPGTSKKNHSIFIYHYWYTSTVTVTHIKLYKHAIQGKGKEACTHTERRALQGLLVTGGRWA